MKYIIIAFLVILFFGDNITVWHINEYRYDFLVYADQWIHTQLHQSPDV